MIQFLTIDEVLESHAEQIATYGGSDGVRGVINHGDSFDPHSAPVLAGNEFLTSVIH